MSRTFCIVGLLCLFTSCAPVRTQEVPESRFFDSDGVQIYYVDQGSGEPVLLVHGFTADLNANWVLPGLTAKLGDAGYRVVAYDSRGHGQSDKPHDPAMYGPVEIGDAIRLLDHLGIPRAHLVGYSRGAMIANHLRAEHPDRFLSVTLGGFGDSGRGISPRDRALTAEIAEALAEGNVTPLARWVARRLDSDVSPERVEALRRAIVERNNDLRALAATFRAYESFSPITEQELENNEVPTLALVGGNDGFRTAAQRMHDVMSNLQILVIPGATHGTAPGRPEFYTALVGFLSSHGEEDFEGKR